jgi:hypothetical protein
VERSSDVPSVQHRVSRCQCLTGALSGNVSGFVASGHIGLRQRAVALQDFLEVISRC